VWAVLNDEHTQGIIELVNSNNDRIIAIIGGAMLEESLTQTVAERLRAGNTANKLLGDGALGTAGSKVDMLYLLRAIDKPHQQAMQSLLKVRNFFAHHVTTSFNSTNGKFVAAMKDLKLHEGRRRYPHHYLNDESAASKIGKIRNNRDKFTVNLRLALIALMRDRLRHETNSNTPRSDETVAAEWAAFLKRLEEERGLPLAKRE